MRESSVSSLGPVFFSGPLIPFSCSDDSFFLSRIHRLGWVHVNHIDFATAARFGGWYPDILDAVLLSRAVGFVG